MENSDSDIKLPPINLWTHLAKLAITEDKPIMLDYWVDSLNKDVVIGLTEDNEKLLVKNEEEYTSPINKIFQSATEYIIITENSIYLVRNDIETRRIS